MELGGVSWEHIVMGVQGNGITVGEHIKIIKIKVPYLFMVTRLMTFTQSIMNIYSKLNECSEGGCD